MSCRQSETSTSTDSILKSCKWIGYTAIGVAIGLTVYNKIIKKILNEKDDRVNIINDNNKWEIPVIASDADGGSYITKEYIKLEDGGDIGKLSDEIPVNALKFRTTPSDYFYDWHTAPKTQFIINLDAPVRVTTTDGDSILLKTGQVFIVRDVNGKGHYSKSVNNLPRKSVFITFESDDR